MDPKGKEMVVNDKEKESFINDPKDDKPTDSGSSRKRKDEKKKKTRRIKEIVYYDDSDESSSSQKNDDNYEKRKRSIQTFLLIILVFRKVQMLIYSPFHLVNLLTLMERTTDFGVTKCVVTCSLSIQAYGR
jgi:negative regulator of genetic competence, sporulation and motility